MNAVSLKRSGPPHHGERQAVTPAAVRIVRGNVIHYRFPPIGSAPGEDRCHQPGKTASAWLAVAALLFGLIKLAARYGWAA